MLIKGIKLIHHGKLVIRIPPQDGSKIIVIEKGIFTFPQLPDIMIIGYSGRSVADWY